MRNPALEQLNDYPFARLADLLQPVSPRVNEPPTLLSVGEPQLPPPPWVHDIIARSKAGWNRYPQIPGTPELRQACARWAARRYNLRAHVLDPDRQVNAIPGSREGLYFAAFQAIESGRSIALMPNPCYQIYYGAATLAGATPVYLPSTGKPDFKADLAAVDRATLGRTAIAYLCNPGNPIGSVMTRAELKRAIALAREHDFLLVVDECYAEIYDREAPVGALEVAAEMDASERWLDNLLVIHTLSKRSNAAGLRSGFAVGSAAIISDLNRLRSYGTAAMPLPIQEASVALWDDDAHAREIRAQHQRRLDAAEAAFGTRFGFTRPPGGFFLWLDVGDGEAATLKLWREGAIRVLPGGYLAKAEPDGSNIGARYIRVALVHEQSIVANAMQRMARILGDGDAGRG